jgi:hypothetical protein
MRAKGHSTAPPVGRPLAPLPRPTGTLLSKQFGPSGANFATSLRVGGPTPRICQLADNCLVHNGSIGLDTEDVVIQLYLADNLAGHVQDIHLRHPI